MDLTNRSLALILVVAIVVSLGGTIISLNRLNGLGLITGRAASDTGQASINITSNINILFTNDTINFGTGNANGTFGTRCRLETNDTAFNAGTDSPATCFGFNDTGLFPFTIENQGNTAVNLNLTVSGNPSAATFIGGTNAEFNYFFENNEAGSCASANLDPEVWTPINSSSWTVCGGGNLSFIPTANSLKLHLQVYVPLDATPTGGTPRTATFTALGY